MTRITQFSEAFWGGDFTCVGGFEALCKRMKTGRNTCKDLLDFFTQRAALEKDYAMKIQKLAKSVEKKAHNTGESSSLDNAIAELIVQADGIANVHLEAAKSYSAGVDRLQQFHENQNKEKKKIEDGVKKQQSNKINQYNRTLNLHKQYMNKCRESDQAKSQFEQSKQSVTVQAKEVDKAKSKFEKCEQTMEQADIAYKSAIENLEQSRVMWEQEMEDACNKFQRLEEERIEHLRNEMWLYCNTTSQACVDEDECSEVTRASLEKCSVSQDIVEFIMDATTGTDRPAKIEYQNYLQVGNTRKPATPPTGHHPVDNRKKAYEVPMGRNAPRTMPFATHHSTHRLNGSGSLPAKIGLAFDGGDYATVSGDPVSPGALMPPRDQRR